MCMCEGCSPGQNGSYQIGKGVRVLVLTNMYPTENRPFRGTFVKQQVEALRKLGVECEVFLLDGAESKLNYFRQIPKFLSIVKNKKFDLVHCHYVHSGVIGRLQRSLPVVVTSHGSDSLGYEGWVLRRLIKHVDAFTVTAEEHKSRPGMSNGIVVPCGVNMDLFMPTPKEKARDTLGWEQCSKIALYVGRDSKEKRLDLINETMRIVGEKCNESKLKLAIGVEHDVIPLYMSAADVLLLLSDYEGAPVVVKEAMSCNLPVISTDVGDAREVTSGTHNCHIVPQEPHVVAERVLSVFEDGSRSDGRQRVEQFSTDNEARTIVSIYKKILSRDDSHSFFTDKD